MIFHYLEFTMILTIPLKTRQYRLYIEFSLPTIWFITSLVIWLYVVLRHFMVTIYDNKERCILLLIDILTS